MRLSELLEDAKSDAPPARFDVDDMVAAGRRRQRRRNTGWALAAVVAVATAIGVPRVLTQASPPPAPPAAVTPSPSAPSGPFAFDFPFRGYTAGGYRVEEPRYLRISATVATVIQGDKQVAMMKVYAPGVRPDLAGRVGTDPVGGRPAGLLRQTGRPDGLIWEYADDAVAVLMPNSDPIPADDLRRIADGLIVGAARPATTPFRVGYLPDSLRLLTVLDRPGGEARASVVFISDEMATDMLKRPDRDVPPGRLPVAVTIAFSPPQPDDPTGYPPRKVSCTADEQSCVVAVGGDGHRFEVSGQGISMAEIRKITEGLTLVDDPLDPGDWLDVNDAVPAFAQLPQQ